MTTHSDWLAQIEVSGPFLAEPVLREAFPQGLEGLDPTKRKLLRQAYDEWREAVDLDEPDLVDVHGAWIDLVLRDGLDLSADNAVGVLRAGANLPDTLCHRVGQHDIVLRPDWAVVSPNDGGYALCLISVYPPNMSLTEAMKGARWPASPAERMTDLCRATGTRLGLLTNGEHWMLVDAPIGGVASFATWHARLWGQEPITLQSFINLLGVRRFFADVDSQLPALLDQSLEHQDDVTEALGEQVRRAVEVLIQALDRTDADRNRELLAGIEPREIYEAALTVMMRIVVLLSADERGLLLMGDERYEANYSVSTLRLQLRAETEEVLERRWDAWSRLLAIFRVVYAGVEHEAMRLPALGGSLFDPDRFPFLEGRAPGTKWAIDPAAPLPIDNRTVSLLLDAVQLYQGRTLSYRALDVEQIGHVYEGLLERTVSRAAEVTLALDATKSAKNPWVTLPEILAAEAGGQEALASMLQERMGSSSTRIRNDLARAVEEESAERLLTVCHGNKKLRDDLRPYFHLIRIDRWGYPLVYPAGSYMIASGSDRRETGAHYTPKSLTEAVVKETLDPLVYVGPAEGLAPADWQLKSTDEILDLKVCDPAMGSGAFLVQVCRYLGDRLVDAWARDELDGKRITSSGEVLDDLGAFEPLRSNLEERVIEARRLVAERCLYGVDLNPLAVELAKLSIWIITLAKGRPFGFLDHNLRCGDSLLGITNLDQLYLLDWKPKPGTPRNLFAAKIEEAVSAALELRLELRRSCIRDIHDVEAMARLDAEVHRLLFGLEAAADALTAEMLAAGATGSPAPGLSIEVGGAFAGNPDLMVALVDRAKTGLSNDLPPGKMVRRPLHWPLAFPEVIANGRGGFDAIIGNPPFVGGRMLTGTFGGVYHQYLAHRLTYREPASVDLVVYFFLRFYRLLNPAGCLGFLARRSVAEGKNAEVGLTELLAAGARIYAANVNLVWPGRASVVVHQVHITKKQEFAKTRLDGQDVQTITAQLTSLDIPTPKKLSINLDRMFQGTIVLGEGFKITPADAKSWISDDPRYSDVLFPFVGGSELNSDPEPLPTSWVINFWDWTEDKAAAYAHAYSQILEKVKPERTRRKANGDFVLREPLPTRWWHHADKRPALYHAIGKGRLFSRHPNHWAGDVHPLKRVIAISTGTTKYPAFAFLNTSYLFSKTICVLADERHSVFAVLSSDIHAVWAWSQKSSMGDNLQGMVYVHGNIFETFPFPGSLLDRGDEELEAEGRAYFDARLAAMRERAQGLTEFYNDFHNPAIVDQAVVSLRELRTRLNRLVCEKYGWQDIDLSCGFHSVGYLPTGANQRFTVSEEARIEILTRLSALNATSHLEEAASKLSASKRPKTQKGKKRPSEKSSADLFADRAEEGEEAD